MQHESTPPSPKQPAARRAVGYLRVSTVGQAERGMGLEAQRTKIAAYAAQHGLELVDTVREAASGAVRDGELLSHEHRPRLLELLDQAKTGGFEVVLVAKLDRLSRDHATFVFLERTFRRHGVEVISATEENGDGAYAEFMRGILAQVAQLERNLIAERMRGGKEAKKRLGRHVDGAAPYGYRSQRGSLTPDDEEAPIVRRIFRDASDGRSYGRIARDLSNDHIPTPRGGRDWSREAVRLILANDAYTGERHGVKRAHSAIVSRRAFNQAHAVLAARRRKT